MAAGKLNRVASVRARSSSGSSSGDGGGILKQKSMFFLGGSNNNDDDSLDDDTSLLLPGCPLPGLSVLELVSGEDQDQAGSKPSQTAAQRALQTVLGENVLLGSLRLSQAGLCRLALFVQLTNLSAPPAACRTAFEDLALHFNEYGSSSSSSFDVVIATGAMGDSRTDSKGVFITENTKRENKHTSGRGSERQWQEWLCPTASSPPGRRTCRCAKRLPLP